MDLYTIVHNGNISFEKLCNFQHSSTKVSIQTEAAKKIYTPSPG